MLPVLMVLRVISVGVFAAGLGALVAWIVSRSVATSVDFAWAASLHTFALTLAFLFIPAAVGATLLMPSQTALVRDIRGEESPPLPMPLMMLLVLLCGAAALQVPVLLRWLAEDRSLLGTLAPKQSDPLGWNYVPAMLLFSMPAMAATTLVSFALTSLLAIIVPAQLVLRALASCVTLQAGLVIGGSLIRREMHTIATSVLAAYASSEGAVDAAGATAWLARHDAAAAATDHGVAWVFGGYLVALLVARSLAPHSTVGRRTTASPQEFAPEAVAPPPDPAVLRPRAVSMSSAAAAFDDSNYSVRARTTMIESLFRRRHSTYDIGTIPPMSRARFSFSWTTGALRREPDGPDLLTITPPQPPGLFSSGSYEVLDAATRQSLATLVPRGSDWEIVHPSGAQIARVLRTTAGRGFVQYNAMIGADEVCRFKWALHGLSVTSAELEVEFNRNDKSGLDRGLAMSLAPILEQQARLTSERAPG